MPQDKSLRRTASNEASHTPEQMRALVCRRR
jgi:hypothetical protein